MRSDLIRFMARRWGRSGAKVNLPPPASVKNILVVRPHNELGDFILGLPAISALRHHYPSARITLVGGPKHKALADAGIPADRMLIWLKSGYWTQPWNFVKFVRELRNEPYDLAICPSTVSISVTSSLITAWSGARLTVGRCQADLTGEKELAPFFDILVPPPQKDMNQTVKNYDFLYALEIPPPDEDAAFLGLPEQAIQSAKALLNKEGLGRISKRVFLHVGAGKPANRWPTANFAKLATLLSSQLEACVVYCKSPGEEELVEKAFALSRAHKAIIPSHGLMVDTALISECDLFVGSDTGLLHVAAAVGIPTIGLYGPTKPGEWAPLSHKHHSLVGENNEVGLIVPEDVLRTARSILSK